MDCRVRSGNVLRPVRENDVEIAQLGRTNLAAAAELIAAQQRAVHTANSLAPLSFADPAHAQRALVRLLESGAYGVMALEGKTAVGVLTGALDGTYASMPAEGFAIEPAHGDHTQVLGLMYAPIAERYIAAGAMRHYLSHMALPALSEAAANMGFGRHHYFAVRAADSPIPSRDANHEVSVRVGGLADLHTIAELCLVEIRFRSTAPIYSPSEEPPLEHVIESHRRLHERGAVHLIGALGGHDVGVLTLERSADDSRMCRLAAPLIGETATLEAARGSGVATSLVRAALQWATDHGHETVSVDYQPTNPLSRRFWLGLGFNPIGFGLVRQIHPGHQSS